MAGCLAMICILTLEILCLHLIHATEKKTVSQCFKTRGNPFITLSCKRYYRIQVERAFHGMHAVNSSRCSLFWGDCLEEQMNTLYDWSQCTGKQQCVMPVQMSWMPLCGNYSMYLQVEYKCITENNIINICQKQIYQNLPTGYIRTPSYPFNYPVSRDCACVFKANKYNARWKITILDMTMEMGKYVKCADYFIIQHGWAKIRKTDINCGESINAEKEVTVHDPRILMHFHSDDNDIQRQIFPINNERKLRGFWAYFKSIGTNQTTIVCGPSKPLYVESLQPPITSPPTTTPLPTKPWLPEITQELQPPEADLSDRYKEFGDENRKQSWLEKITSSADSDNQDASGKKIILTMAGILTILANLR